MFLVCFELKTYPFFANESVLIVDSRESLTREDRPRFSGTTNKVTKRTNTDQNLDRLINWQYLLPPIKLFYSSVLLTFMGKDKKVLSTVVLVLWRNPLIPQRLICLPVPSIQFQKLGRWNSFRNIIATRISSRRCFLQPPSICGVR